MGKTCSHGRPWEASCQKCDDYWRENVSTPLLLRMADAEGFTLVPKGAAPPASAAPPGAWRPIETAPRDALILMGFKGRRYYVTGVVFRPEYGAFVQTSDYSPVELHTAIGWQPAPGAEAAPAPRRERLRDYSDEGGPKCPACFDFGCELCDTEAAPAVAAEAYVLRPVLYELERAVAKFPTWPTDALHALGVLGEEFGELTKEVLQLTYEPHKTSLAEVRKEALQTAAMALRFMRSLDRYEFKPGSQHAQESV